ncbi:MAG: hypothetical protein AAFZ87_19335, partial [Planctomycetota bacterium]
KADERLDDDVPDAVKKERNQRLLRAAERAQRARFERYRGRTVDVLVESASERDARIALGRTLHGMPVSFEVKDGSVDALLGTEQRVEIAETTAYGMAGARID